MSEPATMRVRCWVCAGTGRQLYGPQFRVGTRKCDRCDGEGTVEQGAKVDPADVVAAFKNAYPDLPDDPHNPALCLEHGHHIADGRCQRCGTYEKEMR